MTLVILKHHHCLDPDYLNARCLKITEKVSFNIASKASYIYILSGQKFIKTAKNGPFWRVFENLKLAVKQCYQTGQFLQDKNWWKMPKFKCDIIMSSFQTLCERKVFRCSCRN